jgi:hypothetical protein
MNTRHILPLAAALLAVGWGAQAAAQGKVYRWVDENGVVHFGDAIPPEYSKQQHDVMDQRGARTTVHDEKPAQPSSPMRDDRDRALLGTYATVDEIETVRDSRIGYLDAQNDVARDRLENLRARRGQLEDNPAMINELAIVEQRIREYDAEITRRNGEIERIQQQFAEDIARFRELKGLDEPKAAAQR